ncbi:MAG: hypothetical protein ACREJ5_22375 [Geminicoccaceae bacterium]
MTERFEHEFYPTPWRRVLPVGPYGIQPYVRATRERGARPGARDLRRLAAIVGRLLRHIVGFGRPAANGVAKRPLLEDVAPRGRRPALRARHRAARPSPPGPTPPRPGVKAACSPTLRDRAAA